MKTNKTDNCIPFDDIALLYDETRFFPQDREIKAFDLIIDIIRKHYDSEEYIENKLLRFFDAGTGTGRLMLPFINQLAIYLSKNKFANINFFEFYCLDISMPMLEIFKRKLNKNKFIETDTFQFEKEINKNIKIKIILVDADLRTYYKTFEKPIFDVVFTHWIFHTIRDWQLALLSIVTLSKEDSLLFTFEETSDLYYAIDNNLSKIGNKNQKKFWEKYFYFRKNIYSFYGLIPLSANERIGSHVQDNKIYDWISKIYTDTNGRYLSKSEWDKEYTYEFIINEIIGKQLFSNMKLLPNNNKINPYSEISKSLNEYYLNTEKETLAQKFISHTTFRSKYFILKNKIDSELAVEIFKDAISKRNPDDLFSIPNRAYEIFIDLFWKRVNQNFIEGIKGDNIKLILGVHFFDNKNDTSIQINEDFTIFPNTLVSENDFKEIWCKINNSNESDNPFLINLVEKDYKRNRILTITNAISNELKCLAEIIDKTAFEEYINNNLRQIKYRAINQRLTYILQNDIFSFFQGLIKISNLHKLNPTFNNFHFFPSQFITPTGENKAFGLLIITENLLSEKIVKNIQNFNLLLFSTLSRDLRLDLSINVPVVISKHKERESPVNIINKASKFQSPDILIVTAFASEFEQALKLAGVKKSAKETRNLNFPNKLNKTNRKLPQVYDISSPNFKDQKIWLFQCFQTGNGDYGIEYTLTNVLEFIIKQCNNKPKLIVMGGVTAGMQERIQLKGQILVADCFWNIDNYNDLSRINKDANSISCDLSYFSINENIKKYIDKLDYLTKYKQKIEIGTFITVKDVLNDYSTREKVRKKIENIEGREIKGLEMEGFGFAKVCKEYDVDFLFCKGISDFAHRKDEINDFQKNVAKNTFDFIYFLIENIR